MAITFYIGTVIALRTQENTGASITAGDVYTLQESFDVAEQAIAEFVRLNYPASDGWMIQDINVTEVPNPLETDGYRLTWHVEPVESS